MDFVFLRSLGPPTLNQKVSVSSLVLSFISTSFAFVEKKLVQKSLIIRFVANFMFFANFSSLQFFSRRAISSLQKNSGLSFKSGMSNVNNSINIIWLRKRAWLHLKTIYLILWNVDDLQLFEEVCFKKCCNFNSN